MELGNQRGSDNIEDRRGMGGVVGGGIGVGTLVIAVIAYFLGIDPTTVIDASQQLQQAAPSQQQRGREGAPADEMGQFVSKVLASTEDVWTQLFRANGRQYHDPKLILYTGSTRTACGVGQAAMGPFYCPNDEQLYIDLAFYDDLRKRFGAPGDFAQAYVIAHEIGHHVQKQLGIMDKLQSLQGRSSRSEYNKASVRVELQADCFAGVWGHHAANARLLDPGDMEEALAAATAIGDDRLQKQSQGYVVPESFTHGSSAQRARWFKRGMDSGKVSECDTFNTQVL
ncbi:MAG TPA: neutral zinc metallopeptidase [Usitatibacter sp.]|nr:neutral zinc metallopeptidase [Usitatibacter sp.]